MNKIYIFIVLFSLCTAGFVKAADDDSDETQSNKSVYDSGCTERAENCQPSIIGVPFTDRILTMTCAAGLTANYVDDQGKCYTEDEAPVKKKSVGKWVCFRSPSAREYNCKKKRFYDKSLTEEEKEECNASRRLVQSHQEPCGDQFLPQI